MVNTQRERKITQMSTFIEEHCEWLIAEGSANNTVQDRQRFILYADRHLPEGVDDAHTNEVVRFLATRRWSPNTRNTYWRHLNGYYDWGVLANKLRMNPMDPLACPPEGDRLPDPIETADLYRMLALLADPDSYWHRPWHLTLLLAAYEGFRVGDITTLLRSDVTEDRIRVRRGKGGKDAYVDTHPLVWAAVKDVPSEVLDPRTGKRSGVLVRDHDGSTMTAEQVSRRAWYMFRRFGLPTAHLHKLRHWHATALLEAGADLETVRQCMRHSNIASTVNYLRIASKRRREAVLRLPVAGVEPDCGRLDPPAAEAA